MSALLYSAGLVTLAVIGFYLCHLALQKPLLGPLLRERCGALVGVGAGVRGAGGPLGGNAVSLLQRQYPQGSGDVDGAQAVAGAGGRHGRATQGVAVRCADQHNSVSKSSVQVVAPLSRAKALPSSVRLLHE